MNQAADEKFPTTAEDLQGFWDMLMLQVNHVDRLFEEIEEIRKNDWKVRGEKGMKQGEFFKLIFDLFF